MSSPLSIAALVLADYCRMLLDDVATVYIFNICATLVTTRINHFVLFRQDDINLDSLGAQSLLLSAVKKSRNYARSVFYY